MKSKWLILLFLALCLTGPFWYWLHYHIDLHTHWKTANRNHSADIAPKPNQHPDAIVQLYCARAYNWRGLLADHCWLAVKPKNALHYTTIQVIGFALLLGRGSSVVIKQSNADNYWFNHKPRLINSISGKQAEQLIPKLYAKVASYPYHNAYTIWPGPNSNSFVAYLLRQLPEFKATLPTTAIGKDYLVAHPFFATTTDHHGYQISIRGLLGLSISSHSGIELNLLGFVFGISFKPLGLYWPGIGLIHL